MLRGNTRADFGPIDGSETLGPDDEHSSRRRARNRCIAGAVRESVRLAVGVKARQRCFQRQSTSRGRAIQCLPTFARMTGSKRRRTHVARRGRSMGATVRGHHAAPTQSRKQASAGPARDAWFATNAIAGSTASASSQWRPSATPRRPGASPRRASRPSPDRSSSASAPATMQKPRDWPTPSRAGARSFGSPGSFAGLRLIARACACVYVAAGGGCSGQRGRDRV
jgi:hypothetical protein